MNAWPSRHDSQEKARQKKKKEKKALFWKVIAVQWPSTVVAKLNFKKLDSKWMDNHYPWEMEVWLAMPTSWSQDWLTHRQTTIISRMPPFPVRKLLFLSWRLDESCCVFNYFNGRIGASLSLQPPVRVHLCGDDNAYLFSIFTDRKNMIQGQMFLKRTIHVLTKIRHASQGRILRILFFPPLISTQARQ